MQKSIRRDICSPFEKLLPMLVGFAQTISSKYYIFVFHLNLIITIGAIVLCIPYKTRDYHLIFSCYKMK